MHTVKANDTTQKRKTAETLLEDLEDVYWDLCENWGSLVVGLVTDTAGTVPLFAESSIHHHHWLLCAPGTYYFCYKAQYVLTLQINLIIGDFIKSKSALLLYRNDNPSNYLIAKQESHTFAFGICDSSNSINMMTTHYIAYRRLFKLYSSLVSLAPKDSTIMNERERVMIAGDAASQNPFFWHNIVLRVFHFIVVLTLTIFIQSHPLPWAPRNHGKYHAAIIVPAWSGPGHFQLLNDEEKMKQDIIACEAILTSIEAHWAKSDQEVIIATVLVNPFYRMLAFRPLQCFNKAEIMLSTRLCLRWRCLYTTFWMERVCSTQSGVRSSLKQHLQCRRW